MRRWLSQETFHIRAFERDLAVKRIHLTTLLLAAAVALTVGFAGGLFTGHYVWKPTRQQIARSCPPNEAQIGCVVKLYAQHAGVKAQDPSGPHFPDVYEGQGFPNWAAARPSISGAVVKAYEYRQDHSFAYNASQLTRLGIRWGAYLFVRGCGYGPAFAATVRPWIAHISVLVLDMEVPAAGGCAPALYASVHAIFPTVRIVIYSGPGTWPGGSSAGLSVWVASYGPSHPPCLFTCHTGASGSQTILAFQYTDGTYGQRTYVAGIGYGDVSQDFGIFGASKWKPTRSYDALVATVFQFGHTHASERNTVRIWDQQQCRNPVRRTVCKTSRAHLLLLQGRIYFIAQHRLVRGRWVALAKPRWGYPNRRQPLGSRFQLIANRLT